MEKEKQMENRKHTCCHKLKVKRGLWSPDEDEKLIKHVTTYGHGSWAQVPQLAGLQRCGKSCRLRWINYLRPDLKKGSFALHEAVVILELHRIVGNKWAEIAKQLPGRTDNEVKNFWNSNIKKKIIAYHKRLFGDSPPRKRSYGNNYNFISNDPKMYLSNAYQVLNSVGSSFDQVTTTLNTSSARTTPPSVCLPSQNEAFIIPPDHLNPTQAKIFNQDEIFMNAFENSTTAFQNPNLIYDSNQAYNGQEYSMLDFNEIPFEVSTHGQQVLESANNQFSCFQPTFGTFQTYEAPFDQPTFAFDSTNTSIASSSSTDFSFLPPPTGSSPLFEEPNLDMGWAYSNTGVNY